MTIRKIFNLIAEY